VPHFPDPLGTLSHAFSDDSKCASSKDLKRSVGLCHRTSHQVKVAKHYTVSAQAELWQVMAYNVLDVSETRCYCYSSETVEQFEDFLTALTELVLEGFQQS
jgi:hypothetical protein